MTACQREAMFLKAGPTVLSGEVRQSNLEDYRA